MNEQEFKNNTEQRWNKQQWRAHGHKAQRWTGVFLLVVGSLLMARASGADIPRWFFSWPMLLIGIGLFSGIRHGFRNFGWLVPVAIGVVFLTDEIDPNPEVRRYLWPAAIITVGLLFIFRPKKKRWLHEDATSGENAVSRDQRSPVVNEDKWAYRDKFQSDWEQAIHDGNDVIDTTAIFGGVKKIVMSKNFKGGDVTTFMGGAEINLSQADCNGRVMIDCFNMFGGTKLIVPADWDVQSGLVTIFGGIEDKRQPGQVNPSKVLYLDGTCIFGGVEIKSF